MLQSSITSSLVVAAKPSRGQIVAALTIGSVGLLIAGLQPLLLGELVAHKRISLEGLGLVAMGEIIAIGLGVIMGNTLLSAGRLSGAVMLSSVLLSLVDLMTVRLVGDMEFVLARALAGILEGVLVWVTTSVIVRTAAPERLAAVYLVTQTLAQAAVAALLATLVIPSSGWSGGFVALAALSAMLIALAPTLRPGFAELVPEGSGRPPRTAATVVTFAVILAQMAAIGSLWAYLDPLGRGIGLTGVQVGALISVMLLLQVLGGSVAAWVVRRLWLLPVLTGASVLLASCALALYDRPPATVFCALCGLFAFVWLFVMPFQVRLAFAADPAGRVAVLVPALQLLGVACGPLLASLLFVTDDDARPVPLVCAGFALFALCLLMAGRACFGTRGLAQHPSGEKS